ncbi:hypothetical protein J7E52_16465 [Bacillus sp. ISL-34]|uniref:hypothetical protein n=1 Tax=Bacillus sp. ISL-34 TaxID=2819121 RepID=UPI001BE6E278|nr:hypothetical protein [Bacillus sp. ISL-34]MBT2648266.1 hypothetical protein [Bacillus sp. ISL-34]
MDGFRPFLGAIAIWYGSILFLLHHFKVECGRFPKSVKRADEALYIAKNSGRAGYMYMGPVMEKGAGNDCRSL